MIFSAGTAVGLSLGSRLSGLGANVHTLLLPLFLSLILSSLFIYRHREFRSTPTVYFMMLIISMSTLKISLTDLEPELAYVISSP